MSPDTTEPEMSSEETLLLEKLATEAEAFAALYDRYFGRVYNYVRYRVAEADTADDLTSEIFSRALRKIDSYAPAKGPFAAWLFAIARNTVNSYHRREQLRRLVPLSQARNVPAPESTPEEHLAGREERAALLKALQRLSPRERDIISLRFAADLRYARIARLTGLSEANLAVIVHRALRKLRDFLEEDSPGGEA